MNKITARGRVLVAFFVVLFVFSIIAISLTSGISCLHECTGVDCIICAVVTMHEHLLNLLILSICVFGAYFFLSARISVEHIREELRVLLRTPVCLKVKLSN